MADENSRSPQDPSLDPQSGTEDPPDRLDHTPPERTPFDNPWLLPGLLLAGALWFAYDGFLNPTIKAVWFNRIGALVLAVSAFVTGRRALQEQRSSRPPH